MHVGQRCVFVVTIFSVYEACIGRSSAGAGPAHSLRSHGAIFAWVTWFALRATNSSPPTSSYSAALSLRAFAT